jgi:hypothetical protein
VDIEKAYKICLKCHGKLGDFETILQTLREIAHLTAERQTKIAKAMSVDPITFRGFVMLMGYACNSCDWIKYHRLPATRDGFKSMIADLKRHKNADPERSLFSELTWGAEEMLRLVDWNIST